MLHHAIDNLRALGTPSTMRDLAARGCLAERQKVNAHVHLPPNFSAFLDVKQVLDLAGQQGIGVLGASNYYDYDVYGNLIRLARAKGIFPLLGLEVICWADDLAKAGVKINDPGNPGKFYLCGKAVTRLDPMTPEASRLLNIIRRNDSARMAKVVARLAEIFDRCGVRTGLTESGVIERVVHRCGCPTSRVYLQERHVCQAFQERFFDIVPAAQRIAVLTKILGVAPKAAPEDAVKIQNEIRSQLLKAGKPAYVEETFVNFEEARRLIIELGGVPCYPVLVDGTKPICPFEDTPAGLIERIRQRGIGLAEFIPIRNSPAVLSEYVKAMRSAGLVITAGTEHNTLDMLPLEPTCLNGQPIPEDVKEIFWEGACVVAAQQFLAMHGEPGLEAGCSEEKIASLAKLGAVVIRKYQEATDCCQ